MRRISTMALLVTALVALLAQFAQAIDSRMESRKVVTRPDGRELFVPAAEVSPSDVIEYRLTYANDGQQAVRNVAIVDPVPDGTRYVELSATRPQHGSVKFSIDSGKTYHDWPVQYTRTDPDGTIRTYVATPEMVTHIRWTLDGNFDPNTAITFSYRTIVE